MLASTEGDVLAKTLQATGLWVVVAGLAAWAWPDVLGVPQLWMLATVGIAANALQPSYRLLEGSRTRSDRLTAVQILYSVYLVQITAVAELCWRGVAPPLGAVSLSAFAVMLAGIGLRTWAVVTLGGWFTWNVTVQAEQPLIESGPYRRLRHPSYTGALLAFGAAPVLLHSWWAAGLAMLLLPTAFLRRIRHEEALLRAELPGYEDYARRTWALLPPLY